MTDLSSLPKVNCQLVGSDGNAFSILARFKTAAKKVKWPLDAIDNVISDAMSGDYSHLLVTIEKYCKDSNPDDDDEDDFWDED
jgi:hypothetical protein